VAGNGGFKSTNGHSMKELLHKNTECVTMIRLVMTLMLSIKIVGFCSFTYSEIKSLKFTWTHLSVAFKKCLNLCVKIILLISMCWEILTKDVKPVF
jgi:hypothetical protein